MISNQESVRILVTGKSGQVGFELQRALAPLGTITAVSSRDFDLASEAAIRSMVQEARPDVIVNAAAYTRVDQAESEPDLAFAINARAPAVLGAEAHRCGALLIHYSTDYIFDGTKSGPYIETDTPNPVNVYGRSKLAGELEIMECGADYLILRSSWIVSATGANFAKTILKLAAERESLEVVADQWGAPTSAELIADVTAQILGCVLCRNQDYVPCGIYHLTADGETNWCEFAQTIVRKADTSGRSLRLTAASIRAISSSEYRAAAPRPPNSRLDTRKLRATFGLVLPDWRQGVNLVLERIFATS